MSTYIGGSETMAYEFDFAVNDSKMQRVPRRFETLDGVRTTAGQLAEMYLVEDINTKSVSIRYRKVD